METQRKSQLLCSEEVRLKKVKPDLAQPQKKGCKLALMEALGQSGKENTQKWLHSCAGRATSALGRKTQESTGTWAGCLEFPAAPAPLARNPSGSPTVLPPGQSRAHFPDRRVLSQQSVPRPSGAHKLGSLPAAAPCEPHGLGWAPSLGWRGHWGLRECLGMAQSHGASSSLEQGTGGHQDGAEAAERSNFSSF